MFFIILIALIGRISCDQTLSYTTNDTLQIPFSQNVILSSFMSVKSNESVSGSDVRMLVQFYQNPQEDLMSYNIIYFNLQNQVGLQCYKDYFNNNLGPQQMLQTLCHNQSIDELKSKYGCYNMTNCQDQNFTFIMQLNNDQFTQDIIIVENKYQDNDNTTNLILQTSITMYFQASIGWFYGSVALTCLLLINIVFLTGVTLYWILKYRRVKRIYEQFRLTEIDYQTKQINNTMKQQ